MWCIVHGTRYVELQMARISISILYQYQYIGIVLEYSIRVQYSISIRISYMACISVVGRTRCTVCCTCSSVEHRVRGGMGYAVHSMQHAIQMICFWGTHFVQHAMYNVLYLSTRYHIQHAVYSLYCVSLVMLHTVCCTVYYTILSTMCPAAKFCTEKLQSGSCTLPFFSLRGVNFLSSYGSPGKLTQQFLSVKFVSMKFGCMLSVLPRLESDAG